jgi:DNA-binding NtrC family response regulator
VTGETVLDGDALAKLAVLVVEDDGPARETLREFLIRRRCSVTAVGDGERATVALEEARFDVVITDLMLPVGHGVEVLKKSKSRNPGTYVVLMTGFASLDSAIDAVRFGAFEYLVKPFSLGELELTLTRILEHRRLSRDNQRLAGEVERLRPLLELSDRQDSLERTIRDLVVEIRSQTEAVRTLTGIVHGTGIALPCEEK